MSKEIDKTYFYIKRGSLVIISEFGREDVYTKEACQDTLNNIKKNHDWYSTEESYQYQIDKLEGALKLFDDEVNSDGNILNDKYDYRLRPSLLGKDAYHTIKEE